MGFSAPTGLAGVDVTKMSHARAYDYVLGGKDNFAVDREAAEQVLVLAPDTRTLAWSQRLFLARMVRLLAVSGIRQFIDIGTGIPTYPNVHAVAREVDPTARVVYVDNDPIVVVHDRALLATDDGVVAIQADVREAETLLGNAELQALIDFTEPVAVLCVGVFHLVTDEENPAGIVARIRERMAAGSYLTITQFCRDGSDPKAMAMLENATATMNFRTREEILRLFPGFELLPPGLVDVERWRPEEDRPATALNVAAGVAKRV
jgi:hypothetical protein